MTTISIDVARMERELRDYSIRAQNDERLIVLLKEQNTQQAREIEMMTTEFAEKIRRLSQERDEAVRKATEVSGILNQAADGIMSGLRKMKGDELPPAQEIDRPNLNRIGKLEVVQEEPEIRDILSRLPRNELPA
ncbi:MAG TPA: hypothetical protein VLC51_01180 [Nitrospira sp.]|nr:hypothetical protein [Nitrospira sp.]